MHSAGKPVLDAREARWRRKTWLAGRFGQCVLSLCLNIPGPDKNLPGVDDLLAALSAELDRLLAATDASPTLHDEMLRGADGPCRLLVLALHSHALKQVAVRLEEGHVFGRLADADVLAPDGTPVTRRHVGLPPRRCFLCDEDAAICRRAARHSAREVTRYVATLLDASRNTVASRNCPQR